MKSIAELRAEMWLLAAFPKSKDDKVTPILEEIGFQNFLRFYIMECFWND